MRSAINDDDCGGETMRRRKNKVHETYFGRLWINIFEERRLSLFDSLTVTCLARQSYPCLLFFHLLKETSTKSFNSFLQQTTSAKGLNWYDANKRVKNTFLIYPPRLSTVEAMKHSKCRLFSPPRQMHFVHDNATAILKTFWLIKHSRYLKQ